MSITYTNVFPNNFDSIKRQKELFLGDPFGPPFPPIPEPTPPPFYYGYINNHPHRLPFIKLSGTLDIEYDGREPAGAGEGIVQSISVDLSLLPEWTRIFDEKTPILEESTPATVNEFHLYHRIPTFWRFHIYKSEPDDPVIIGESTSTEYTWNAVTEEWDEGSTTTSDIEAEWYPVIESGEQGGDIESGGKGADNDANSVGLRLSFTDTGSSLPIFSAFSDTVVYRLPWEDPWANESVIYDDALADWIDARNAEDGNGWSGTTTMTLEFS